MKAVRPGTDWCDTPSDAVVGQQWTCPECGEHWTALQGHVVPVTEDGALGDTSEPYVIWEQTWRLDSREELFDALDAIDALTPKEAQP